MRTRMLALVLSSFLLLTAAGCAQAGEPDTTGDGLHATVPDVVGMTVQEARDEIDSAGYAVGDVSPTGATGTVTAQEPAAGVSAARGASIDLDVGE